jgi:hypothetical protein
VPAARSKLRQRGLALLACLVLFAPGLGLIGWQILFPGKSSLETAIEEKDHVQIKSLVLHGDGAWQFGTLETKDGRRLPIAAKSTSLGRDSWRHTWVLGQEKPAFLAGLKSEFKEYGLDISEDRTDRSNHGISYTGSVRTSGDIVIEIGEFFQPLADVEYVSEREIILPKEHWSNFAGAVLTRKLNEPVRVGEFAAVASDVVSEAVYEAPATLKSGGTGTALLVFDLPRDARTGHVTKSLPRVSWK